MRYNTTLGFVGLIVALSVGASACGSDPTSSEEYRALQTAQREVAIELEQMTDERDELSADLATARDDYENSMSQIDESEAELVDALVAIEDETTRRIDAEWALAGSVEELDIAFGLVAVNAANYLSCGDPDVIAGLPSEVRDLREQVAASSEWFETAVEYDTCQGFRSFAESDSAVTRAANDEMTDAWDRYWDAPYGSEDESLAAFEFELWRILTVLDAIDGALDLAGTKSFIAVEASADA